MILKWGQPARKNALSSEGLSAFGELDRTPTLIGDTMTSYIIRDRETGRVIMETFDKKLVAAINAERYEVVPIREYLVSINGKKS